MFLPMTWWLLLSGTATRISDPTVLLKDPLASTCRQNPLDVEPNAQRGAALCKLT